MNSSVYLFSPSIDQAYVIAKFLKKYQPECHIIGVGMSNENTKLNLKYIDKFISADLFDLSNLKAILVPTGAVSTEFFLGKGDVSLGEIILAKNTLKVFDKLWLLSNAKKAKIPVPRTWSKVDDIVDYPIFYKQYYEEGGGARGIAYSKKDIPSVSRETLIFQELIVDQGTYGVAFLAKKGVMLCNHMHFERESIPESGGSAVVIESIVDAKLLSHAKKLINFLEYSGWGLVEFKYCSKRDDYVLMEINAKFWASCELAFINEPKFLKLLFGISSKEKKVKRLFFIDRALMRKGFVKNVYLFYKSTKFRLYPGWSRRVISALLPSKYLAIYKKYK